jgi:hypothetical protein
VRAIRLKHSRSCVRRFQKKYKDKKNLFSPNVLIDLLNLCGPSPIASSASPSKVLAPAAALRHFAPPIPSHPQFCPPRLLTRKSESPGRSSPPSPPVTIAGSLAASAGRRRCQIEDKRSESVLAAGRQIGTDKSLLGANWTRPRGQILEAVLVPYYGCGLPAGVAQLPARRTGDGRPRESGGPGVCPQQHSWYLTFE